MLDTWLTRRGSAADGLLDALAHRLRAGGLSPDALTYAALATGVGAGVLFSAGAMAAGLGALAVSGLLDAVDGRVARLGRGATPWGGVLDLTSDRIVESAVLLGIALPRPVLHVPALVLATTWYVNLCVFLAVGAASGRASAKVIDYPPGLPRVAPAALWLYALLGIATAAQRFAYGRRALG
jgi:archaetidylinositol phosphate synthase